MALAAKAAAAGVGVADKNKCPCPNCFEKVFGKNRYCEKHTRPYDCVCKSSKPKDQANDTAAAATGGRGKKRKADAIDAAAIAPPSVDLTPREISFEHIFGKGKADKGDPYLAEEVLNETWRSIQKWSMISRQVSGTLARKQST